MKLVAAQRLDKDQRKDAFIHLADTLSVSYPKNPWPLFPHVLEVLQVLGEDKSQASKAHNISYLLTRNVIMAMRDKQSRKINPDHILTLVKDFDEYAPLKDAIDFLLKDRDNRDTWHSLRDELLNRSNLVLRYAMAASLADACTADPPSMKLDEITALVNETDLNKFELGAYALSSIYVRKPKWIEPLVLRKMAGRSEYTGRSALATMLLILYYRLAAVGRATCARSSAARGSGNRSGTVTNSTCAPSKPPRLSWQSQGAQFGGQNLK